MAVSRFTTAALLALTLSLTVAGCARDRAKKGDTAYVARDVETLYNLAKDTLDKGQYRMAAALFDEVERQHPYSVWARRAQLMSAFSYYAARQYSEAVLAGQRFLSLHPGNRDAPYAYYIIAVSQYEQIADTSRDQKTTGQALDALTELVRRYPDSPYAEDARLKIDLVNDHLAGKEMDVGRFHQKQRQWIAASIRFRKVIEQYQTTSHTPEALHRLVECYLALGIPEEAKRTAAVLGANYPGSKWYERAYKLVQEHKAA
ncbi:outer membrane protein assembly factor BamD [Sandaracinobacteroides saxicola]|uniref:Outer membrane protein assembly factor BamD n=1 Tax=Sandaracinobacteroides saxicola TaxID=2759707 RepID=A0A7G5IEB0_9SPHN|nr:outer membrane protein assembly factor BamD [Sandaracinobacteroides saxicola]QMW21702.1 outer membrane protein assembly factor BamD [Sandaracinobacteroides saxicola]